MMGMSGRVTVCCVALLLTLTSVSATKRLKSINDLKQINFGQSVPKHSLLLLHWFANIVEIDNNNIIRLPFDPNDGVYGSHHYGNFERMLDQLPYGQLYYTVGNLNQDTSDQLPDYVVHPQTGYDGRNRDRIIFSVRDSNTGRQASRQVDHVYITQHYETSEQQGTRYDPEHTYQVSNNLLRQIRQFAVGNQQSLSELRVRFGSNADDSQLRHIRNTWGKLASLGLLLFIVIQEKYSTNQHNATNRPQRAAKRNAHPDFVVSIPDNRPNQRRESRTKDFVVIFPDNRPNQRREIQTNVTTGKNGKARIVWKNIPRNLLKEEVMVVLFDNDEDQEARTYEFVGDRGFGSYDTSVPLNNGLQARLHKVRRLCFFWRQVGEEICRGPEFESPENIVSIAGYDAMLQLFVKDGKACARLFVSKTFTEWRSDFNKSWVGFYTSAGKATNQYEWWQWQWATQFRSNTDVQYINYDVYEYHTSMAIAPGVQARFILRGKDVKARTATWS